MTGLLDTLLTEPPLLLFVLAILVGLPLWILHNHYHWFTFFEPFERATRGYSPLSPDEKVLAKTRTVLRQNGALRLYSEFLKRVVLTNRRVCVSSIYASNGYWLYTVPVDKIWQAFLFYSPDAILTPYRLRLDLERTDNLQTLEIRFDTPNEILAWKAHLESLGVKIRGDIPWPR